MAREMTRSEFERKMRYVQAALARAAGEKLPSDMTPEELEAYRAENNPLYRRKRRIETEAEWIERTADEYNERTMFAM